MTRGYKLPVKYVFHTVSPVYQNSEISEPLLASCYRSCMQLAVKHRVRSICFPAISCGVFGYPFVEGAQVAFRTIREHIGDDVEEVTIVIFHRRQDIYDAFVGVARGMMDELQDLPPRHPSSPGLPPREPAVL